MTSVIFSVFCLSYWIASYSVFHGRFSEGQNYNLWLTGGGNIIGRTLLNYPNVTDKENLLSIIRHNDPARCHFQSRLSENTNSFHDNHVTRFSCDLTANSINGLWFSDGSADEVLLPKTKYVEAFHVGRKFLEPYRVSTVVLDLDIRHISRVTIHVHSSKSEEKDFKVVYARNYSHCLQHWSERIGSKNCEDLTKTKGFLLVNVKDILADKVDVKLHLLPRARSSDDAKIGVSLRKIMVQAYCECGTHSNGCEIRRKLRGNKEVNVVHACRCREGYCNEKCTGKIQKTGNIIKCKKMNLIRKRRQRRACSCNPAGTLYGLCHPLVSLGNKCLCRRSYIGKFCETCANGFFHDTKCKACHCNIFGSKTSVCRKSDGACSCENLKNSTYKYQGKSCNLCPKGYFGFPHCKACNCSFTKDLHGTCDKVTGKCRCARGYSGTACDTCADGFHGYPKCTACSCSKAGSLSSRCDVNGTCKCKVTFSGAKCDRCKSGFKNYPHCQECGCRQLGSLNSTCDAFTGQCPCDTHFTGIQCEKCAHSDSLYPTCKKTCYCSVDGVVPGLPREICGDLTNTCACKPHVTGKRCNACKPLFYNMTMENPLGCDHCSCSQSGTVGGLRTCHQKSGQCSCKSYATGRTCNECKNGYFGFHSARLLGCKACECNLGGAIGKNCDSFGHCKCKKGVLGAKCNRLAPGPLYVPSLYDLKFELEDGFTLQGAPVNFRYNYAEFPGFSSRGYISMGVTQSIVALTVTVPKSSVYKIVLSYILREDSTVSCVVRLRNKKDTKTFQYGIAIMKSTLNKVSKRQFALVSNDEDWFMISKGEWELTVTSTAASLLLDYAVLMPDEYLSLTALKNAQLKPCVIGQRPFEPCQTYEYLSIKGKAIVTLEGETAYTGSQLNGNKEKRPDTFKDPDILRELESNGMAVFNNIQRILNFDIKTKTEGDHYLVVSFFNPDATSYRVRVYVDQDHGSVEMSTCTWKFICRAVILGPRGSPKSFNFSSSGEKTAIFIANVAGTLAVDSVTAIPVGIWAEDYIKPSVSCISLNGLCMQPSVFPTAKTEIPLKPDKENPPDPLTGSLHAGKKPVIVFSTEVPFLGEYFLVFQYYQPRFPAFDMKGILNDGTSKEINFFIEFCPSKSGCRQHHKMAVKKFNFSITLEVPDKRDFWIDKIFLVPNKDFVPDILSPKVTYLVEKVKKKCFDDNHLPLQRQLHSFCKKIAFALSMKFNDGPKKCQCSAIGSLSNLCDRDGGQCHCRPNVVGRRCNRCRTGYYQFPNCRPCRCFLPGSLSPECSSFGQCTCKPQFGGWRCTRCNSVGYYGFPECRPCLCDKQGSLSTFCRGSNGQCQCRINFQGRTCTECRVGYQNYPECKRCKCDPAGIVVTEDNPTGCPKKVGGSCLCKPNVYGEKCNVCKKNFYNLQVTNPLGCTACDCFAAGTVNGIKFCSESNGRCFCKLFVGGRTCDRCLDGYYDLSDDNIFGCRACDCNPGGSVDMRCDKKTGQCKCHLNIYGRRCDKVSHTGYYIPTFHHIISKPATRLGVDVANVGEPQKSKEREADEIERLLSLKIPNAAVFAIALQCKFNQQEKAALKFILRDSVTSAVVIEVKIFVKSNTSQANNNTFFYTLKDKNGGIEVRLSERDYWAELVYNASVFYVENIILVPREYTTAHILKKRVWNPCTLEDSHGACLTFAYLSVPRANVYTVEAETIRKTGLAAVEPKDIKSLNFNGGVKVQDGKELIFHVNGNFNGSYVILFQYHTNMNSTFTATLNVKGYEEVAYGNFSHCQYTFGCRQVAMDIDNHVKTVFIPSSVKSWSVKLKVFGGNVTVDLLAVIPSTHWHIDFIRPKEVCISVEDKCITTDYDFPEKYYLLQAEDGKTEDQSSIIQSPTLNWEATLLLINISKTTLNWKVDLARGRYVFVFRYYQPYQESFEAKIIVSTQRRAFAGKLNVDYCPKLNGCHGTLKDATWEDQPFSMYINMELLLLSLRLPVGKALMMDYIMLVPVYEYSAEQIIRQSLDISKEFQRKCLEEHFRIVEPPTKFCENALFTITTNYNQGPLKCMCNEQGSTSKHCNHIGGYCQCKDGIIGMNCGQCKNGLVTFPLCHQSSDLKLNDTSMIDKTRKRRSLSLKRNL